MNTMHFSNPSGDAGSTAAATEQRLQRALVDEIECGLIVCDGQGHIDFTNQAAQRELGSAGLLLHVDGYLTRGPGAAGDLDTALRAAAQRGRRSLVRLQSADDRLLVSVLPFGPDGVGPGRVLVMLGRRQPCSDLGLELLAGTCGLTLAERRVLAALVRELTPREIAARHAVAMSTVRTQISSIRAKLGARSIEGLMLRAAEVPPVASALRIAQMAGPAAACGAPALLAAA
jgi:DNA-binding CsgD family transcriptional regulator